MSAINMCNAIMPSWLTKHQQIFEASSVWLWFFDNNRIVVLIAFQGEGGSYEQSHGRDPAGGGIYSRTPLLWPVRHYQSPLISVTVNQVHNADCSDIFFSFSQVFSVWCVAWPSRLQRRSTATEPMLAPFSCVCSIVRSPRYLTFPTGRSYWASSLRECHNCSGMSI